MCTSEMNYNKTKSQIDTYTLFLSPTHGLSMPVASQQQPKFDQFNLRTSELYQLEVLVFYQLMGEHILSLDPCKGSQSYF